MTYRVYQFDGLATPEYKQDGDEDNLGTGTALSSLIRLPGGGFYDTRGERRSLAGLQPITRKCVIWGDTAAALRGNLDDLRAKKGVRGVLTVRFDDDELRWQWARLLEVNAPRPLDAVGKWLPVELSWQPLSQFWYGPNATDWTWGDGSWVFGDGTAEFGTGAETLNLTTSPVTQDVTIAGNLDSKNVVLTVTPSTDAYTEIKIRNRTNASSVIYTGTIDSTIDRLIIDCGAKSCRSVSATTVNLSNIYALGERLQITTAAAHGLSVGDFFEVAGTSNYDGEYEVATVPTTTTLTAYIWQPESGQAEASTGTLAKVTGVVANLTVGSEQDWFYLSPGTNSIRVTITGATIANGVLTIEYTEHYA